MLLHRAGGGVRHQPCPHSRSKLRSTQFQPEAGGHDPAGPVCCLLSVSDGSDAGRGRTGALAAIAEAAGPGGPSRPGRAPPRDTRGGVAGIEGGADGGRVARSIQTSGRSAGHRTAAIGQHVADAEQPAGSRGGGRGADPRRRRYAPEEIVDAERANAEVFAGEIGEGALGAAGDERAGSAPPRRRNRPRSGPVGR